MNWKKNKRSAAGWRGSGCIERTLKTLNGTLKIKIPTLLSEVSLGQLMAMQEKDELNDLDAISILSGIPVEEVSNVRNMDDLQVFGDTVLSLSHQIKYLYNSEAIPDKVSINSKNVNVIRNLSVEPAGAFMAARDIIADEIKEHVDKYGEDDWKEYFNPSLKACCQLLAHYFYCRASGKKYNEYEAEAFTTEIKKLRVTEALPIAKLFFTCYPSLSKPRTGFFRHLLMLWKNALAFSRSKNSSISTP